MHRCFLPLVIRWDEDEGHYIWLFEPYERHVRRRGARYPAALHRLWEESPQDALLDRAKVLALQADHEGIRCDFLLRYSGRRVRLHLRDVLRARTSASRAATGLYPPTVDFMEIVGLAFGLFRVWVNFRDGLYVVVHARSFEFEWLD